MSIEVNTVFGIEVIDDTKVCRDCNTEKSVEDFEPNRKFHSKDNPDGRIVRRPSCRACRSKKKSINASQKKHWNRPDTFECPICLYSYSGTYARLDHCHKTGNVLGWLCDNCNTGKGKFREDIEIMKRAIQWQERSEKVVDSSFDD